ncbi:hypothetical protein BS47DRAFT_1339289 [Hydnum rufescens UP504]|uniref:Uncharacterized protein n=1 Tax=Hydnum rufescens UP504 TaxID=1448309 RepID=A0A9P6DWG5_9AGAM|nr:hypothetical protein BS47DRAFT_1339289 [Hydnum rufescens UP504]
MTSGSTGYWVMVLCAFSVSVHPLVSTQRPLGKNKYENHTGLITGIRLTRANDSPPHDRV